MQNNQKQILLVLLLLLAVTGMIGAGCINKTQNNNNDTMNTENGTKAVNTSNMSDTGSGSLNNTNGTNNSDRVNTSGTSNSNSSSLPDVVVANKDSGGGHGGRGGVNNTSGNTTPVYPVQLNDRNIVFEQYVDENDTGIMNMYLYVPSEEIENKNLTITISENVTGTDILNKELIDENKTSFSGKIVTVSFISDQTTDWDTIDMDIEAEGDFIYHISFYSSASWDISSAVGGSLKMIEIEDPDDTHGEYKEGVVNAGKTGTFATELNRIKFTLTPDEGNVGSLKVSDYQGNSVALTQTGLNTYETESVVTPHFYTAGAAFEKAAVGGYDNGTEIYIDQNLNSQAHGNTIYLYVPLLELYDKTIELTLADNIKSDPQLINQEIIEEITYSGSTLSVHFMDSETMNLSTLQRGGIVKDPRTTFIVETDAGTYNVSVLVSVAVHVGEIPEGAVLTSTATYIAYTGPDDIKAEDLAPVTLTSGMHVLNIDTEYTLDLSNADGYTLQWRVESSDKPYFEDDPFVIMFSNPDTYILDIVKLTEP